MKRVKRGGCTTVWWPKIGHTHTQTCKSGTALPHGGACGFCLLPLSAVSLAVCYASAAVSAFALSLSWPVFCVCLFFILVVVIFSLAICGLVGVLIFND